MPTTLINGKEIHYQDVGEGFPLLFGHTYLWDSRMWAPQLTLLSQYYRCIVPDLWGHGRSATTLVNGVPDNRSLAQDHHALMLQLGLERYSIVGLSVGAMWGAQLAMDYPENVAALVMMGSYLGIERADHAAEYVHLLEIAKQMKQIPAAIIDAVARILFSRACVAEKPALIETFRFDLMSLTPAQVDSITAMGEAIFRRASLLERLRDIRCPTLFIVGAEDLVRPVAESEEMHRLLPGSQLAVIDSAGHMVNLEQPDQVNQRLVDFLFAVDGIRPLSNGAVTSL